MFFQLISDHATLHEDLDFGFKLVNSILKDDKEPLNAIRLNIELTPYLTITFSVFLYVSTLSAMPASS